MKKNYDIAIAGGGASGMAAAVTAARAGAKVLIIERNGSLGRKVLASGNGRCNLGNRGDAAAGSVVKFFESLGVLLREEEDGRLYPYSGQAGSVVSAFENELYSLGVDILFDAELSGAEALRPQGFGLSVKRGGEEESASAKKLIIALGGKAGPKFGTIGDGYRIARRLGHSVKTPYPVLTPIEVCPKAPESEGGSDGKRSAAPRGKFEMPAFSMSDVSGCRVKAEASLLLRGECLAKSSGEVQFTDYGLSGICVMDLATEIKADEESEPGDFSAYEISIDLLPASGMKAARLVLERGEAVYSFVPKKLADVFYAQAKAVEDEEGAEAFTARLKDLRFTVKRPLGWDHAQCTGGGVSYFEVNRQSMESMIVPGLYFAGEILDYDGPCGGYNLQHAWISGIQAGKAAAASIMRA